LSQKANWRSFWPESTFWPYFRSASSELLSELLCFAPPTTATSAHLFPCSNAPVANREKIQAAATSSFRARSRLQFNPATTIILSPVKGPPAPPPRHPAPPDGGYAPTSSELRGRARRLPRRPPLERPIGPL
jgi:hypothetical protein